MPFHVGDTKPDLSGRCTYQEVKDGPWLPANLTGATLAVHVKAGGEVLTIETTNGDADGKWSAPWPAPIEHSGTHTLEVQATYSGGGVQTFGPETFIVSPQIA